MSSFLDGRLDLTVTTIPGRRRSRGRVTLAIEAGVAAHVWSIEESEACSSERRRIAQMSCDAEDRRARMKLLVKALADTQARAELFATAMREESAQFAAAIAAPKKSEHPYQEEVSMSHRWIATIAIALFVPALAAAQVPEMPKPGPEQQVLEYFVGTWSTESESQASPLGPGGKSTGTTTCEWFEGRFYVVCKGTGTGPMGKVSNLGIFGYSAEQKVYTYRAINSLGIAPEGTGTKQGTTWTWTFSPTIKGQKIQGRFTLVETSPTSYTFKEELEQSGKWTTTAEGKSTKKM